MAILGAQVCVDHASQFQLANLIVLVTQESFVKRPNKVYVLMSGRRAYRVMSDVDLHCQKTGWTRLCKRSEIVYSGEQGQAQECIFMDALYQYGLRVECVSENATMHQMRLCGRFAWGRAGRSGVELDSCQSLSPTSRSVVFV